MSKDFKIHSVKYNLIMNVILKMSSFIFPLITFPYISRVLGPIGNGKISFATSIIYYFTIFATLGIPTYGVKICAQYRDDKEKLTKTVKELLIIESIAMIISYIMFFFAMCLIPKLQEEKELLIINSFTIFLTVFGVEWFYQAIEQYDYITFRNLAFKIISICLMFLLVHKTEDYILYGCISVLGTVGSNILNILRLNKIIDLKSKHKLEITRHISPILTLFMLSASTMIYTSLDTVMLGFIKDNQQVGYYNAATKLKGILVSLVTALGTVLLPRLSNHLANKDYDSYIHLIRKSFNFVCLIAFPLVVFCIFEAEDCIKFLAGNGYGPAVSSMQLISFSILFIGLSNIIGLQIFIPTGNEKYTLISTVIGAIVNLILNSILIPIYSAAGASVATSIAELSVLLVQIYFIKNKILELLDIKDIIKSIISVFISMMVLLICINYAGFINSIFIKLCFMAIVFFGIYVCSLLFFKEAIAMEVFYKILSILKISNK